MKRTKGWVIAEDVFTYVEKRADLMERAMKRDPNLLPHLIEARVRPDWEIYNYIKAWDSVRGHTKGLDQAISLLVDDYGGKANCLLLKAELQIKRRANESALESLDEWKRLVETQDSGALELYEFNTMAWSREFEAYRMLRVRALTATALVEFRSGYQDTTRAHIEAALGDFVHWTQYTARSTQLGSDSKRPAPGVRVVAAPTLRTVHPS